MAAKYIMQYIAKVSGGGPHVKVCVCVHVRVCVCVFVFESLPVKEDGRERVHCTLSQ